MRTRLILVAALALAGAACGDDDDDDDAATDTTAAAAVTAAAAPGTAAAAATAPAGEATIVISGFAFPDETTVAAGTPITVRNDDPATHTVTALEGAFNVEVPGGETVTIDALEPGSYDYVCNFHGGMSGTLVVE
jgi:plastocyanin